MKASAASKWPYDPAGHSVAESIDWMRADPAVFASDDTRWKRVCQADAKRLMEASTADSRLLACRLLRPIGDDAFAGQGVDLLLR